MVTMTGCGEGGNGLSKEDKGHSGDYIVSSMHDNNDWILKIMAFEPIPVEYSQSWVPGGLMTAFLHCEILTGTSLLGHAYVFSFSDFVKY